MAATDFSDYSALGSASSTTVSTIKIGATTDSEAVITADSTATGDDLTGTDDEDGVTLPASLVSGASGSFTVNVTNTSGASVFLNAWIDFNGNGLLTDAGEQVAANTVIATGTSNSNKTISFTVPATATSGKVGVRVRLTSTSTPGSTGLSGNGEVEDNLVLICPTITISPTSLPSAAVGAAFTQTLTSSGGASPYTYSVTSGTLPGGLSLSTGGVLSGTPNSSTSQTFTVQAVDLNGCSATRSFTVAPTVYDDTNYNGLRDVGEPGLSNVTVELWDPGADHAIGGSGPNSDLMLTSTTTDARGLYYFHNLQPAAYFMRVLMPTAQEIIGGNPVNLDNGVDNDNNAALQPGGPGTPAYSPIITLRTGQEPTVDDGDPDTNYTVDFGLFGGMSLGNLVWQDSNDNGSRDNGEPGIDGVTLQIWSTGADNSIGGTDDVLLQTTTTSGGGSYNFTSLTPGKFYVRIPTPPGAQPISSSITAFVDNGVDNVDKGLQLSGGAVNSPVITLTPGTEPGTSGGSNYNSTIDFGLVNMTPTIYMSATQADSIEAFDATSGLYTGSLDSAFGNSLIDALVTRPAGAHADLRFSLEGSSDLATWTTISLTPATTTNADQTQTQRYSQVDAAFSGASRGFLRLKVTLDANLDGTPEAATTTGALGWARVPFAAGRQSLSMPLLLPAIYTGKVSSISGSTVVVNTNGADIHAQLQNGVNYYVEVMDGTLKGRTLDIDASATSGGNIVLTSSADTKLVGTRITIRPHWTLGALLPVGALQPATTEDAADRVMFFDSASGQFQIDWLHTTAGAAQWVRDGDASLANDGSRIIPPQAGMLVQLRTTPTTLTLLGEVRTVALALPQTSGTSLRSTGLATPQTPGALPFTPGSRLRLWSGDADPTVAKYQNYLLNPQSEWVDETTGLDVTQQPLLDAFRAFFLVQP